MRKYVVEIVYLNKIQHKYFVFDQREEAEKFFEYALLDVKVQARRLLEAIFKIEDTLIDWKYQYE